MQANLKKGNIVVAGCSIGEIADQKIGSASKIYIADAITDTIMPQIVEKKLLLVCS
jgi:uncharacterized protein YwlG (UPF0340 family)